MSEPLEIVRRWIEEAEGAGEPAASAVTLATASPDGLPSARTVSLMRLEGEALVFASGLWTRKVAEIRANPHAAIVFHWPLLGRQVVVEGEAGIAERSLAEELFAARPRSHQLQILASRQGETISDPSALRARLEALSGALSDREIDCPADWGAIRLTPTSIELWRHAPDRIHERRLFRRHKGGWSHSLLAP
jgi:pyridoxamine 5'-phosphate oxidase